MSNSPPPQIYPDGSTWASGKDARWAFEGDVTASAATLHSNMCQGSHSHHIKTILQNKTAENIH